VVGGIVAARRGISNKNHEMNGPVSTVNRTTRRAVLWPGALSKTSSHVPELEFGAPSSWKAPKAIEPCARSMTW